MVGKIEENGKVNPIINDGLPKCGASGFVVETQIPRLKTWGTRGIPSSDILRIISMRGCPGSLDPGLRKPDKHNIPRLMTWGTRFIVDERSIQRDYHNPSLSLAASEQRSSGCQIGSQTRLTTAFVTPSIFSTASRTRPTSVSP